MDIVKWGIQQPISQNMSANSVIKIVVRVKRYAEYSKHGVYLLSCK